MAVPRLRALGDAAWTVEFGDAIDPALHALVMGYAARVEALRAAGGLPGVVECVPSFRSLTVHFDPLAGDPAALGERLLACAGDVVPAPSGGRRLRVPVRFGGADGPDLDGTAAAAGLSVAQVVGLMTASLFKVYLLGFMPGFPYMGGLPAALALPRLATPRTRVPARSLAVAGPLCGVYPFASPGGWRLVGRTPLSLFEPAASPSPTLFEPGDEVMWRAVDADEFARIEAAGSARAWADCRVGAEEPWPA